MLMVCAVMALHCEWGLSIVDDLNSHEDAIPSHIGEWGIRFIFLPMMVFMGGSFWY